MLDILYSMGESIVNTLFGSATSSFFSTLGGGILVKILRDYLKKTANPVKIYKNTIDYIDERDIPQKITGEARKNIEDIDLKQVSDTDEFV